MVQYSFQKTPIIIYHPVYYSTIDEDQKKNLKNGENNC